MTKKSIETVVSVVVFFAAMIGAPAYFVFTTGGAKILLHQAFDRYVSRDHVSWSDFQGTLWRGFTVKDLELQDVHGVGDGGVIRIQECAVRMKALRLKAIEADFHNARLLSLHDEPVVAEGRLRDGQISANVYALTFDLQRIKDFFPAFRHLSAVRGSLKDIDLVVEGTRDDIHIRGRSVIEKWRYATYLLQNCELNQDLRLVRTGGRWHVYGKVTIVSGDFLTPRIKIKLGPSRIEFSGDPERPSFDITGQSKVSRTKIDIVVRGTRDKPEVILSSDSGLPQEQLLLMLTTGKRWNSMNNTIFQKGMTPEIATDFVDYFLFGGSGKSLSQYLGLSNLSVSYDQEKRGVSVSKDVTERLGVGYGVKMETPQNEPATVKQQVTGEYDITDRVTIGIQKEVAASADPKVNGEISDKPVDDRVYMKYKTKF
ncbi:MAG: translocation/assembly module TamB domain-containing protein [Candidatus Omnitrophica bacterium]|nr:translocation/assembly module TamB domain-containing protein [Candidatus Omnitrophota bacterium]